MVTVGPIQIFTIIAFYLVLTGITTFAAWQVLGARLRWYWTLAIGIGAAVLYVVLSSTFPFGGVLDVY